MAGISDLGYGIFSDFSGNSHAVTADEAIGNLQNSISQGFSKVKYEGLKSTLRQAHPDWSDEQIYQIAGNPAILAKLHPEMIGYEDKGSASYNSLASQYQSNTNTQNTQNIQPTSIFNRRNVIGRPTTTNQNSVTSPSFNINNMQNKVNLFTNKKRIPTSTLISHGGAGYPT